MRLEPQAFNRLLRHLGQNVLWRRASHCPCRDPHSYAASPSCAYCQGRGVFWDDGQLGVMGLTGMARNQQWGQAGLYEIGDLIATLPEDSPVYGAGDFDRIVFVDTEERFDSVLTRGGANDRLWACQPRITRVTWMAAGQLQIGGMPSVNAQTGVLTWPGSRPAPPAGVPYMVAGWRRPEYFVWSDQVQSRFHHAGARLPRRVVLRRFDLFGR